jgi:hypothetical protein
MLDEDEKAQTYTHEPVASLFLCVYRIMISAHNCRQHHAQRLLPLQQPPFLSFLPVPLCPICLSRCVVHAGVTENHSVLARLVSAAAAVAAQTSPVTPVVEVSLCSRRRRRG